MSQFPPEMRTLLGPQGVHNREVPLYMYCDSWDNIISHLAGVGIIDLLGMLAGVKLVSAGRYCYM